MFFKARDLFINVKSIRKFEIKTLKYSEGYYYDLYVHLNDDTKNNIGELPNPLGLGSSQ